MFYIGLRFDYLGNAVYAMKMSGCLAMCFSWTATLRPVAVFFGGSAGNGCPLGLYS